MTRRVRAAAAALAVAWVGALHAAVQEPCAPPRLSETGLYVAGRPGVVDPANRAFSPQYPLWSDGAAKARWIYLPPGTAIDATDASDWRFPVGTRFWKEFTFNGRKVETRFLWRATADRWIFATYLWNEEQTDGLLAPEEGVRGVVEVAPGRSHDVPGSNDCRACHGARRPGPLGFNALQLSTDRDPNAIHGEPLAAGMIDLGTLVRERRLAPARPELVTSPPRIRASSPLTRSVLGYSTTWQVPGQPEGASRMLNAVDLDASAMLVRMRSRRPSSQMPPLGTVLRDDQAIAAVSKWLATDLSRR